MAQHVRRGRLNVFGQNKGSAGKKRAHLCAAVQSDACAGRSAERKIFKHGGAGSRTGVLFVFVGAGYVYNRHDVAHNVVGNGNVVQKRAAQFDRFGAENARDGHFFKPAAAFYDALFFFARRIIQQYFEQKAVEFGFGQIVRSFLIYRVLRRHNEKGLGKFKALFADCNLIFAHSFEQGRLHFCGRTVYFVRQKQIRKHRSLAHRKASGTLFVNKRTRYVGGQKIGRKLNALKREAGHIGKGFYRQRFCQTRNAFKQNMTAGDEGR